MVIKMTAHRRDIIIAVCKNGAMLVAQGKKRLERVKEEAESFHTEIVDFEDGLFFSQLSHRTATRNGDDKLKIVKPKQMGAKSYEVQTFRTLELCDAKVCFIGLAD